MGALAGTPDCCLEHALQHRWLCGAPAGGDRCERIEGSRRWTGSLIAPARLMCTRRA